VYTGELLKKSTVSILETVQKKGNREIKRSVEFYNLLAVENSIFFCSGLIYQTRLIVVAHLQVASQYLLIKGNHWGMGVVEKNFF